MSQEHNKRERSIMAYRAMEALGIERQMVKPVLKRLLHEYDDHWELIEDESYRALADAIFEAQDSQKGCSTKSKIPLVVKGPQEKRLKSSENVGPSQNPRRDGPACKPPSQNRALAQKRPFPEQSTPAQAFPRKSKVADLSNKPTIHNSALMLLDEPAMPLAHTGERSGGQCSRSTSDQNKSLVSLPNPNTAPELDQSGFGPLAVVHPSYVIDSSENSKYNCFRPP